MDIKKALEEFANQNLDQMRENISSALSQKAAESLEERKTEVAKTYFEPK